MRTVLKNRGLVAFLLAFAGAGVGTLCLPWPGWNPYLVILQQHSATSYLVHEALRGGYFALWLGSSWMAVSVLLSLAAKFWMATEKPERAGKLPAYIAPNKRKELRLTLGETHHRRVVGKPVADPTWLEMPELGMYTGICALGAIGSGKTSSCLRPYADQILGWQAHDPAKRIGGLTLEIKGDFCAMVQESLRKYGRSEDYIEIRPGGSVKYNPMAPHMEPEALAFSINSLMVNLHGRDRDSYWGKATQEAIKNIIMLYRRTNKGHCTLHDILLALVDQKKLAERVQEEVAALNRETKSIVVSADEYLKHTSINFEANGFVLEENTVLGEKLASAPFSTELFDWLRAHSPKVRCQVLTVTASREDAEIEAIQRWHDGVWRTLREDHRGSIVSGISPFLSLFDSNAQVRETFCPAPDDPDLFAGFPEVIEQGKVVALKFDVVGNPGMARLLGTFLKQDFQRAVRGRISADGSRDFRPVLFLCDEYQQVVTVGENDPNGDEHFLALSRQAKCIPIVAAQSLNSLRAVLPSDPVLKTLLQCFLTKLFLHVEDYDTAKFASDLCGKEERLIESYTVSESGSDARISAIGAKSTADKSSITATKSYHVQLRNVFEPDVFLNLPNFVSIIHMYDGSCPQLPQVLYLRPWHQAAGKTWFDQQEVVSV